MESSNENCSCCGHEKTDWLNIITIEEKPYCEMCIKLGIAGNEHYKALAQQGFSILTSLANDVECDICGHKPSMTMPVFTIGKGRFCTACLFVGANMLKQQIEKDSRIAEWLKKREN